MVDMLSIGICDDDNVQLEYVEQLINEYSNSYDSEFEIYTYSSEKLLLDGIKEIKHNILFMDVEIDKANGIEISKRIQAIQSDISFVFISGHTSYSLDAYAVEPVHYLVKPIDKADFFVALDRAIKKNKRLKYENYFNDYILVNSDGLSIRIDLNEFEYAKKEGRKILIKTIGEKYLVNDSIKNFIERINSSFIIRINQSTIINISYVKEFSDKSLLMNSEETFLIGRGYKKKFKNQMFIKNME
jgi:DNA-binding LytR/AlgR family response regulator